MAKNLYIKTYGCQMNVYDSIRMEDLMKPHGYNKCEDIEESDMVILNTCHIREKAAEKVYSEIGRLNKISQKRKDVGKDPLLLVVAGCVGQAEGEEIFSRAPAVNIVVGPQSYHSLPELVAKVSRNQNHLIELDFIEEEKFDKLPEISSSQGTTAFVSVQEGCDKFCSFCVVPYTRGSEFSRPLEEVYRETLKIVSQGSKEVTLLGQNVNAYHGKKPDGVECDLADLIYHLSEIKGLERIRYTTSHPRDMNDNLIEAHGKIEKLMPFLHLPVQSGSNKILKDMNRKHSREEYFDIIKKLKEKRPDIALSSDFIVGFPGETDEDFADTLDLVKKIGFAQTFSFKYSPRPGTPASIKTQLPENIKSERLTILQKELHNQQLEFNKSKIGMILPVLFEKDGKFANHIVGKTPYLQSVFVDNPSKSLMSQILNVKITSATLTSLGGEILSEKEKFCA